MKKIIIPFVIFLSSCGEKSTSYLSALEKECFDFSIKADKYLNDIPKGLEKAHDVGNELSLHSKNLERFEKRLFDCEVSIVSNVDGYDAENRDRIINIYHKLISVKSVIGVYEEKFKEPNAESSELRYRMIKMLDVSLER